ncbi:MAG: glycosyl hydrolase, partial [Acidobacteriota bacterium]
MTRRKFLIAAAAVPAARTLPASELTASFAGPPREARPSTYWVWLNGFTDARRVTYELEELKKAGVNAAYILEIGARGADVPPGPAYMGPESLRAIGHAVREAGRLGLEIGLTNSSSWNAGGAWVTPEHASKGLYWSRLSVQGPARFSQVLPFPELPAPVPRKADGSPAYFTDVAVLAVPEKQRWPGFDFVFDLAPGIHTVNRVTLHNAAAESAVREFVVHASDTGAEAGDFREVFRGVLEARTGPQTFPIPDVRAKFLKLRVLSGHHPARVALAEFEAFSAGGKNVVTVQLPDGRKTIGGLLRFTTQAGLDREWMAENLYDGRLSGAIGSWAADSPPPPWIKDPSEILDLTSRLDSRGRLAWNVPSGAWTVYRFIAANNGEKLKAPSPHSDGFIIDHFSADAARMHTRYMLDRMQSELGDLRRTALKYFYVCSYEVRGSMWTPTFQEEFRRRRGYDIRPFLPVLAGAVVENDDVSERFHIDYRRTLSDLIVENFYRVTREMAGQYGLKLVAEAGGPGWPLHQVPVDALKAQGELSIPRGEFWKGRSIWVVKETASAAHVYGQRLVQMEAFTSFRHWQDGPRDIKDIADRAFCDGANHFVWHTMPHVPEQAGKPGWVYHAGTHFGPSETWWPMVQPFLDYLARCSWMLRQGLFVADICYYYGERGFNFAPEKSLAAELGLPAGYDFDTANSDVLLTRMAVKNGRFVLADGMSYEVLVLPDRPDMDVEILERIEQLVREGAVISGPKPRRATSLKDYPACDARVRELAERLWGDCDGLKVRERSHGKGRVYWGVPVADILRRRGLTPDFTAQADLDYIHRREGARDIYFVRNKREEWARADCVFRVKGRPAELWDPQTGEARPVPVSSRSGGSAVTLALPPLGSVFVVWQPGSYRVRT